MGHAFYQSAKSEQAEAYREYLRRELESFRNRKVVVPRSHVRILRAVG